MSSCIVGKVDEDDVAQNLQDIYEVCISYLLLVQINFIIK